MTTPDRTLASIVKILNIRPIEGADKIVVANVLGWEVVIQKDQFKVGDMAIYFEIDSILEKDNPNTAFLEGKRLKTKVIRGQISQGLLGPLSWLTAYGVDPNSVKEGDDVTAQMKVTKWVSQSEMGLYEGSDSKSVWLPFDIPKTDEPRIQACPKQLAYMQGKKLVITQKYDGTSTTYATLQNRFYVCGRNRVHNADGVLPDNSTSHYFEIVKRYDLERKMLGLNRNLALQGEIIGPKINGNRHKVDSIEFYVFNLWDVDKNCYVSFDEMMDVVNVLGLKSVPVVFRGILKDEELTVSNLLKMASEQKYTNGKSPQIAEGIVIKTDYGREVPRASIKVISNEYLRKYDL